MSKKRGRKHFKYTPLGKRMAALAKTTNVQIELGKVLGVEQQTISKKLRGECAILVSDLRKLAKRYRVKMTYFFED